MWPDDPGYGPEKALDGDMTTRWASANDGSNPAVITVLFKETHEFNYVLLNAWNEDKRIGRYDLQYLREGGNPDNDADWIEIVQGNTLPHEVDFEINFVKVAGDGVRALLTKNSDLAMSLYEFQVKNTPEVKGANQKDNDVNLLDGTHRSDVFASSTWSKDTGFDAVYAVDGNMGTRWASAEDGTQYSGTFTVLFNETYTFNYILINQCMSRIASLEIQYLKRNGDQNNEADWITFTSCGQWGQDNDDYFNSNVKDFRDFGEMTGDGLRLKMTGNGNALSIWEFQARYQ